MTFSVLQVRWWFEIVIYFSHGQSLIYFNAMKRKIKKKDQIMNQINVSEEFGKFADDYISQGSNIAEVRNYVNFACIAWNISLFPEPKRIKEIENISNEYERLNPEYIKAEHLKLDLEILVTKKLKLYHKIKRLITTVSVEEKDDNYIFYTESKEFQP
ncbi:MAG: hypothetical protein D3908_08395 [Candidatus Electrothrix sp. AUS4]|nr:hypothetical protein [Candidatus Electrothrix sp. AUS4]